MILGIDVGGANTKIASSDGSLVETHYLPLWRCSKLQDLFVDIKRRTDAEALGAVMTGELSDRFDSKKEGVLYIAGSLRKVFDNVLFLSNDCTFEREIENPMDFTSTNWIASSNFIGSFEKNAILLDIGSTTTDVIPIVDGKPVAKRMDIERLKSDELIYAGALRTNIAHILNSVIVDGVPCRTSSELFAITADVYLALGSISSEDYTCDTPDAKGGKDIRSSLQRIARVVCCDLSELGEEGVLSIATQVKERQIEDIVESVRMINEYDLKKIVAMGIGEFLAEEAAARLCMGYLSISGRYGDGISNVFPAYASARLLERNLKW
jgi:hypothetical protein